MQNKALVTILVPIYNVEKYIAKCLNSLIKQTYNNIEILAIDDGSPDNSKEIVLKFAERDSRIKLISKNNGGYGSALEVGIFQTKTKYFLICDPDDWLADDAIQKLVTAAEKNDLDLVVGSKFNVYEGTSIQEYVPSFSEDLNIKPGFVYKNSSDIQRFAFGAISPHAKLYKTNLAVDFKFPYHVSYTDFVLYILFLTKAKRVEYIDSPLAYYLIDRKGNTTTSTNPSRIKDYLVGWESIMSQLPLTQNSNINEILFRMFLQLKFILSEYSKTEKVDFNSNYFKKIYSSIKEIQLYKDAVLKGTLNNVSVQSKLLNYFLLNEITGKMAAKFLTNKEKYKQKHNKR